MDAPKVQKIKVGDILRSSINQMSATVTAVDHGMIWVVLKDGSKLLRKGKPLAIPRDTMARSFWEAVPT